MSLILKGQLLNIFHSNDFIKEDGTVVPGKTKLQLLIKKPLKQGGFKNELIDLSIPKEKRSIYQDKINKEVEVDVDVVGKCTFYGV